MGLTTTKELRWDASGAPTLSGTVGSFRILIRDFLLDCGWSLEWEDSVAQKVVLRNSVVAGGSGCYIRIVDDGSVATYGARAAEMWLYESMSDIDTGSGACQLVAGVVHKSATADSTARAYCLAGDERTIHGNVFSVAPINMPTYYVEHSFFSAGDYEPAIPGDPGCYAAWPKIVSGNNSASSVLWNQTDTNNTFRTSRSSSLSVAATPIGSKYCSGLNTAQSNIAIGGIGTWAPYPPSGFMSGMHSLPYTVHGTDGSLIGILRGLRIPMSRVAGAYTSWTPAVALGSGKTYRMFRGNSVGSVGSAFDGGLLVDTTGPW